MQHSKLWGFQMHANYIDIVSRIAEPPSWWDENAVPRYCSFAPEHSASIYIGEIALVEIRCQACKRQFFVAVSAVNFSESSIADATKNQTLHYGDPPAHRGHKGVECGAGDSMNSIPRRIVEYWHRHDPRYLVEDPETKFRRITDREYFKWKRDAAFEVSIQRNFGKAR